MIIKTIQRNYFEKVLRNNIIIFNKSKSYQKEIFLVLEKARRNCVDFTSIEITPKSISKQHRLFAHRNYVKE